MNKWFVSTHAAVINYFSKVSDKFLIDRHLMTKEGGFIFISSTYK